MLELRVRPNPVRSYAGLHELSRQCEKVPNFAVYIIIYAMRSIFRTCANFCKSGSWH